MDDIDRKLIGITQREFPIEPRPYEKIGERIGIGERDVLARLEKLREAGLLRRIGASLNPRRLGYTSTLAAARVPQDRIEETAEYINRFPQVTHNYERDDEFNLWFTVIARDAAEIADILNDIRAHTAAAEIIDLPATNIFKIDVKFDLKE